jgi:hypothetical protein
MARQKAKNLKADQNMALQGLTLQEKLNLLHNWKRCGEISDHQYNHFSNLFINKEARKQLSTVKSLKRSVYDNDDRGCARTCTEGEIQTFIDKLRSNLTDFLTCRENTELDLSENQIALFRKYIYEYPFYRSKINRLLIVGLRYPNKSLNKISSEYVKAYKMATYYNDDAFWLLLWEDGNLVPLDAVRLMIKNDNDNIVINNVFDKRLISNLIPLIEIQRDKEINRLMWAQSLDNNSQREKEVARKTRRLEAFNTLLKAANEYVNS